MKMRFATKITAVFLLICCAFGMLGSCGGRKYEPKSEWDRVLLEEGIFVSSGNGRLETWWKAGFIDRVDSESLNVPLESLAVNNYYATYFDGKTGASIPEDEFIDAMRNGVEVQTVPGLRNLFSTKQDLIDNPDGYTQFGLLIMNGLRDKNSLIPIEHIKKIDSDHLCVIYRSNTVETGDVYAYITFSRDVKNASELNADAEGELEQWNVEYFYLIGKKLSSADFDGLNVGDDISAAIAIDPVIALLAKEGSYVKSVPTDLEGYMMPVNSIYRILSDGVLVLEFECYDEESKLLNKTFYSYGATDVPDEIALAVANPALFGN